MVAQSFDVDLYLYMHWRDSTLNHSSEDYVLVNDPKVRDKMWWVNWKQCRFIHEL